MTQHYKEIINHPERVSNIKSFIDLYKWDVMKYATVLNIDNYALFERKNPEIAIVMPYVNVDIKPFIEKGAVKDSVYKSIKQLSSSIYPTHTLLLSLLFLKLQTIFMFLIHQFMKKCHSSFIFVSY